MLYLSQTNEVIDLLQEVRQDHTVVGILKTFVFPVIVALITFYATFWLNESRDRKRHAILGKTILESLLEEVKNGVALMKVARCNNKTSGVPPSGSWEGMASIPDTCLERILMLKERSGYAGMALI